MLLGPFLNRLNLSFKLAISTKNLSQTSQKQTAERNFYSGLFLRDLLEISLLTDAEDHTG